MGKKSLAIHYRLLKSFPFYLFIYFGFGGGGGGGWGGMDGVKLRNPKIGALIYSSASSMCIDCPSLVSFFPIK